MKNDQFFMLFRLISISARFGDFKISLIVGAPGNAGGVPRAQTGEIPAQNDHYTTLY